MGIYGPSQITRVLIDYQLYLILCRFGQEKPPLVRFLSLPVASPGAPEITFAFWLQNNIPGLIDLTLHISSLFLLVEKSVRYKIRTLEARGD